MGKAIELSYFTILLIIVYKTEMTPQILFEMSSNGFKKV